MALLSLLLDSSFGVVQVLIGCVLISVLNIISFKSKRCKFDFSGRLIMSKASGLPFEVPLPRWVCGIGLSVFLVVGIM